MNNQIKVCDGKNTQCRGCLVECDKTGYTLNRNFSEINRKVKNFQQRIGRILEGKE